MYIYTLQILIRTVNCSFTMFASFPFNIACTLDRAGNNALCLASCKSFLFSNFILCLKPFLAK